MALNQQTLQGNWNQIKGKLRERWGSLTDDELQGAQGNVEQLVGTIQQRTGESREAIEDSLQQMMESGQESAAWASGAMADYTQQASESMQAGLYRTQEAIRHHPFESLLTCFGAGLITGVVVGYMMRPRY